MILSSFQYLPPPVNVAAVVEYIKAKAVPLHATKALGERGIAPTHS
jgi:hypothetical protein